MDNRTKWLQLDSNPEPLSSEKNTQPFGQYTVQQGILNLIPIIVARLNA